MFDVLTLSELIFLEIVFNLWPQSHWGSSYVTGFVVQSATFLIILSSHWSISSWRNNPESSRFVNTLEMGDQVIGLWSTETYLHDFQVILKQMLQKYLKILKKCFFGTTCIAICLAFYNIPPYYSLLPFHERIN